MSTTDETTTDPMVELKYSLAARQRQRLDVTIPAEASSTAGLAIAPCLARCGTRLQFTGAWELRHVASGRRVVRCRRMGLGQARDAAGMLGELDVDWTQPRETVVEACPILPRNDIFRQVEQASKEERPARMHSSWQQLNRGWFLYDTDGDDVVAGCFDDVADAEKELRYLTSIGQSADCVIRREDREPWSLRCTWVDCPEPLGGDERLSHPDPAGVVEFADGDGWRQVTAEHWLCPTCSHLFTTIHQF